MWHFSWSFPGRAGTSMNRSNVHSVWIVHTVSQHGELFVDHGHPISDSYETAKKKADFIAVREGPKCQVWIQELRMERVQ